MKRKCVIYFVNQMVRLTDDDVRRQNEMLHRLYICVTFGGLFEQCLKG